jgi:hypothetical protein
MAMSFASEGENEECGGDRPYREVMRSITAARITRQSDYAVRGAGLAVSGSVSAKPASSDGRDAGGRGRPMPSAYAGAVVDPGPRGPRDGPAGPGQVQRPSW